MSKALTSIAAAREARERKARQREREQAAAAAAEHAARPRHEQKAIDHERKRWKKKDYKPGLLAPDSTTQFSKRYKRKETQREKDKRALRLVAREQAARAFSEYQAREKERLQDERAAWSEKRAARRAFLKAEDADLLKSSDSSLLTLQEAAAEMQIDLTKARGILKLYGVKREPGGFYQLGQVLRAALVWRLEHPVYEYKPDGFFTYDEAAVYIGVARKTIENHAREERWERIHAYLVDRARTCALLRADDVNIYKERHDAWIGEGESDHAHCLKLRQKRRLSPHKMKRR